MKKQSTFPTFDAGIADEKTDNEQKPHALDAGLQE
jgi:hypothetical protein